MITIFRLIILIGLLIATEFSNAMKDVDSQYEPNNVRSLLSYKTETGSTCREENGRCVGSCGTTVYHNGNGDKVFTPSKQTCTRSATGGKCDCAPS